MAKEFKEKEGFEYAVNPDFDFVIEESGNNSINFRKISWNGRPEKLDLRKYAYKDGKEMMMKGISITDTGADELTGVLVEHGYGETKRIISALRSREDFKDEMLDDDYVDDGSEDFYDPKQLLGDTGSEEEDE